jgi:hypothetical protein
MAATQSHATTATPAPALYSAKKQVLRTCRTAVQQLPHAWLGQAGLYRTRFDAVRNFEQSVTPVSADELFNLASKQVLNQLHEPKSLEQEGNA